MQISKKKLAVVVLLFSLASAVLSYAFTAYQHNVATNFEIKSSYNINVTDAITGLNWSSWQIGAKYRADFPISSGPKNVSWIGDSAQGIYLWWNSTFSGNVTITSDWLNGATWQPWDSGIATRLPMGQSFSLYQVRFSIAVLSTISDGNYSGTIYLNADPK